MLKLEVGKTYVDGRAHKILIGRDDGGPDGSGPMRGRDESGWPWWYERDGRSSVDKQHPELTLIREHTEESPAEVPAPQAQQDTMTAEELLADLLAPAPPEKLHPPLPQQAATPFDQFKGFDYTVTRGGASTAVPVGKGGLSTSPDLTPMGHQIAPHWAKDHS